MIQCVCDIKGVLHTTLQEKEAVYSRVYQMGQRLLEADNYGIKEIGVRMDKLKVQWEDFAHQLKRWTYLFQNSVEFHRKAQDVSCMHFARIMYS